MNVKFWIHIVIYFFFLEQDKDLEKISEALSRIKNICEATSEELEIQKPMLNTLQKNVTKTTDVTLFQVFLNIF